ncbi:MAG: family ATPase, partial [Bacteroidota bacterium]|nr:family ATPase [Bacteroidota bacterium]
MAIYHYHRRIGKRGDGKNAVFAVAYIRGEKRTCPRTNVTNDFTKKEDIVYTNTFIPEDSPLWASQLRHAKITDSKGNKHEEPNGKSFSVYAWNQIELLERRVDSQLYFHDDVALPNALNKEQAIELVHDFVKTYLAKDGIFCDTAIHWDEGNHHFHMVMPLRALTDDGFSKKIRFTKAQLTEEVKRIREAWAIISNRKLETLSIDERIDHRSYKERGINLKPSIKMGKFNHLSHGDVVLRKRNENELIRESNAKVVRNNPEILSEKILQERPSFDSRAISDEISRYALLQQEALEVNESFAREEMLDEDFEKILGHLSDNTGIINERALKRAILENTSSDTEFDRIYNKIITHKEIYSLGLGEDGRQHYVSKKAFDLEKELLTATHQLSKEISFQVSKSLVQKIGDSFGLNEAQQRALLHLTRSGNMSLICGFAGTGKTYMLKAAKAIWDEAGFKVIGLSTSGKAVSGLQNETGIFSRTIFSFLEAAKKDQIVVDDKTILVMDEMGMTSMDDMHAVVEIARANKAKCVGVGDIEQTQPVGRGAPLRAMIEEVGAVYLDTIIRQKTEWQREATRLFETNQTALGFDLYESHGAVLLHESDLEAMNQTVSSWHATYVAQKDLKFDGLVMAAFK